MPKCALGHLKNLGGYADRNAKKARLSAQKEEKENIQASLIDALFCFYLTSFQPNRNTSTGMPGIPFSNPSFSPPMHDLLDTTPCDHPIDVAVPPFWLYADLFLSAAIIIEKKESPAPPQDTTSTLVVEFFTTANGDGCSIMNPTLRTSNLP
jgi:hypothetical protein